MSNIYNQMWFHVFFGMILYSVAGTVINHYTTKFLEEQEEKRSKRLDKSKDL